MNKEKFNAALKVRGKTLVSVADGLGMSYQRVQYRNRADAWKAREVKELAALLELTDREIKTIFL